MRQVVSLCFLALLFTLTASPGSAGELTIIDVEPDAHALTAPTTTAITVRFDRAVDRKTVEARRSFWAFGRWSGAADGTFSYTDGDQTVILQPNRAFSAGETVMVILSEDLRAVDGSPLQTGGYSFQFWTRAAATTLEFQEIQRFSTRTEPGTTTQSYGGFASDLDEDGHLDLTIINEDTSDMRTFLNLADGTGTFDSMLTPEATGTRPSPSEPTDFNADGHVDVCTANILGGSVSILLGNGDGTFSPHQEVTVGSTPRGIAVLDVDGDGEMDIVNTNSGTDNMSLLRNNGSGVFGTPEFFGSGNGRRMGPGRGGHERRRTPGPGGGWP